MSERYCETGTEILGKVLSVSQNDQLQVENTSMIDEIADLCDALRYLMSPTVRIRYAAPFGTEV